MQWWEISLTPVFIGPGKVPTGEVETKAFGIAVHRVSVTAFVIPCPLSLAYWIGVDI